MRGQVVGALAIVSAPRHHLLATGFEALQRTRHFAQGRQTTAVKFVEDQHDAFNFRVLGCRVENGKHITELDLRSAALQLAQQSIWRASRTLLHQRPLQVQHQR